MAAKDSFINNFGAFASALGFEYAPIAFDLARNWDGTIADRDEFIALLTSG